HKKNPEAMLRRWIGADLKNNEMSREMTIAEIKPLLAVLEPVKGYRRGALQKATQFTPLTRLADIAQPDSEQARNFAEAVDWYLYPTSWFHGFGYLPGGSELNSWKEYAAQVNQMLFPTPPPPSRPEARSDKDQTVDIDSQIYIRSPLLGEEA